MSLATLLCQVRTVILSSFRDVDWTSNGYNLVEIGVQQVCTWFVATYAHYLSIKPFDILQWLQSGTEMGLQ